MAVVNPQMLSLSANIVSTFLTLSLLLSSLSQIQFNALYINYYITIHSFPSLPHTEEITHYILYCMLFLLFFVKNNVHQNSTEEENEECADRCVIFRYLVYINYLL